MATLTRRYRISVLTSLPRDFVKADTAAQITRVAANKVAKVVAVKVLARLAATRLWSRWSRGWRPGLWFWVEVIPRSLPEHYEFER